jgi:hypothetical protein
MSQPYSYRNPTLSLWQAAVVEVHRRRDSLQDRMAIHDDKAGGNAVLGSADDLMSPVHAIAATLAPQVPKAEQHPATKKSAALDAVQAVGSVPLDCAKIAAQFAWAEMTGDHAKSQLLAGELNGRA